MQMRPQDTVSCCMCIVPVRVNMLHSFPLPEGHWRGCRPKRWRSAQYCARSQMSSTELRCHTCTDVTHCTGVISCHVVQQCVMTQSSLRINNNYISLFLCCGTPSHFFKHSSFHSLAQNCWGAPLTCQACFGAAALRCGILRTKMLERHSHNVLNFVSSPFMSFHYERMKCQIMSNPFKSN